MVSDLYSYLACDITVNAVLLLGQQNAGRMMGSAFRLYSCINY